MSDELVVRLRAKVDSGLKTPGGGTIDATGKGTTWGLEPILVLRNPDGPQAADRIERLTAEVKRLDYSTTHTCWDECPRLACAQRREIDALRAQLAGARESERAAVVAYLRGYFVGTDYANAIEAGEHLT